MSVGTGIVSGGATGLKLGANPLLMAATGGLSAPIGAAVGAVSGGLMANKKKKAAESAQNISATDPNEVSRMQRLNQITRNLERGADTLTQNKISEVQKMGAQTQGAISRVSGGDVGSTMQGLLQAQRNVQTGTNQALADRGQLGVFQGLAGQLGTRMSQRALELQLLNRNQKTAEFAQGAKENNLNANAAIGVGLDKFLPNQLQTDKMKGLLGMGTPELGMVQGNAAGQLSTAPTMGLQIPTDFNIPGMGN